jgi:hypothetical protein
LNVVARIPTPVTPEEALRQVAQSWPSVFDRGPTNDELALVLALAWIETARGTRCFNWNLGNITAGKSWPNDAWRPPWFDFDGGTNVTDRNVKLHELMRQGKAPEAFRGYSSLEFGVLDYLRVLRAQYPDVLAAAATGDPDKFRDSLARMYSPEYSNPDATRTLGTFQNQFLAVLGQPPHELPPKGLPPAVGVAIALGVAAAAVGLFVLTLHPPRALRGMHAAA